LFPRHRPAWLRPVAALALLPFLTGAVLTRGLGAMTEWRGLLFPCLWLYLALEILGRDRQLRDGQVFLLGSAFSFLYDGLWTKKMQEGVALTGLDWVAVLGGPLEWGMIAVLLLHCLRAVAPREASRRPGLGAALLFWSISVCVSAVFLGKTWFGHFRAEHFLGPMWLLDDALLAVVAVWLWRQYKRGTLDRPAWMWGVAGGGLLILGSGMLAQLCGGFSAPKPIFYFVQAGWLGFLAAAGWAFWRDRLRVDEEPVALSRPVLAAAGLRVGGTLLLLAFFGAVNDSRMAFWAGLICDLPSKMLFYYAFLNSRLEV
jgi:hypothetical protein